VSIRRGTSGCPASWFPDHSAPRCFWKTVTFVEGASCDIRTGDLKSELATAAPRSAAFDFFRWTMERGQKQADDLHYVPLPPNLVQQIEGYWKAQFADSY
jgi:hypothetical protein